MEKTVMECLAPYHLPFQFLPHSFSSNFAAACILLELCGVFSPQNLSIILLWSLQIILKPDPREFHSPSAIFLQRHALLLEEEVRSSCDVFWSPYKSVWAWAWQGCNGVWWMQSQNETISLCFSLQGCNSFWPNAISKMKQSVCAWACKDALVLTNAISEQNNPFLACACKDAIGFDECNL